ncbi:MAG: DUF4878 domain-containing protein [Prevotellaceae bacterium]|jgi:hypothetical protein|nr:DUF4878 domain-containing protein [Prevotellaceae bacterium]
MKRMIFLLMPLLVVRAMSSCSKKHKTASESAKEYTERIKNNDYDGFIEYVYIDEIPVATPNTKKDVNSSDVKAMKVQHVKALKSNVEPHIQKNEGLKNITVKSENVASDGKSANATLNHEYNNGQTEDVTYDLVLMDDVRKVNAGKNREVWKTKLADGTNVSFTLKENDY